MESTKQKMTPLPTKLQRLRRTKAQLRVALDNAAARVKTLTTEVRRAREELDALEAEQLPYLDAEKSELYRDRKAKREELDNLEGLLSDATSEREELQADMRPTQRTVRALEEYLGIHEEDEFIRPNNPRFVDGGFSGGEA